MEKEFVEAFNELSMRVLMIETGIQCIAHELDAPTKAAICARFRRRSALVMQEKAHLLTPRDDAAMTLCAAALLEALGEPPSRG